MRLLFLLCLLAMSAASPAAQTSTAVEILPEVSELHPRPLVSNVSASGDLVAGVALPVDLFPEVGLPASVPFLWSPESGYTRIELADSLSVIGTEVAVIPDGSGLVGTVIYDASPSDDLRHYRTKERAFRWTPDTGVRWIETAGRRSEAIAASGDGSIVVGLFQPSDLDSRQTVRWMPDGTREPLPEMTGFDRTLPYDVSADGTVVVGTAFPTDGRGFARSAFRWTGTDGVHELASVAERYEVSEAFAVSADGRTVVGYAYTGSLENLITADAFLWREGEPLQILGQWKPHAVSADGTVVLGDGPRGVVVWTADSGTRALSTLFDIGRFSFFRGTGVSADGSVLVGTGHTANGDGSSWRARLPALNE